MSIRGFLRVSHTNHRTETKNQLDLNTGDRLACEEHCVKSNSTPLYFPYEKLVNTCNHVRIAIFHTHHNDRELSELLDKRFTYQYWLTHSLPSPNKTLNLHIPVGKL